MQEDTNGDGKVDENDTKQPIKWQILSKDGDDLFLLADKALDCKLYNDEYTAVTWETCTLRTWLNNEFLNTAFSKAEQKGITTTNVVNADNPFYHISGGNDTKDYVTLLSLSDIVNPSYGFPEKYCCNSETRIATGLDSDGTSQNGSWWWLRSPGDTSGSAAYVYFDG